MVSFQCDGCGDVVKKPKLNQHGNRCYATFTCIDCSVTFQGTSYQSHNSCMTEAQKFQKHIYQNNSKPAAPVKKPEAKKEQAAPASKPVSIVDQLNEKKRKSEAATEEKEKKESKSKKAKTLTAWSSTELSKDESTNLELAVKEVLKNGKSLSLKDVRKKTIELIEKHPEYKKPKKSDLKKSFDKKFTLILTDNSITFA